jgi:hypothetical protein
MIGLRDDEFVFTAKALPYNNTSYTRRLSRLVDYLNHLYALSDTKQGGGLWREAVWKCGSRSLPEKTL